MKLVVVLEGDGQISHRSRHVRFELEGDVAAFHRPHEALLHAVALRTAHRRGYWFGTNELKSGGIANHVVFEVALDALGLSLNAAQVARCGLDQL